MRDALRSMIWRRRPRFGEDPEAAMFTSLRVRLTLWYCAVLGLALVLFSLILYFGMQQLLLNSVDDDLVRRTQPLAVSWQMFPRSACMPPPAREQALLPFSSAQTPSSSGRLLSDLYSIACFDAHGHLFQANGQLPKTFLTDTLVRAALTTGHAADTVDGGDSYGHIRRYAYVVRSPTGSARLGVVLVGESLMAQEDALRLLLSALVLCGVLLLCSAGLGGMFLADRALVPARLAFERQKRFVADAFHELRTPLTLLSADAEVLLRRRHRLLPEDAALLEDISAECRHMATLANRMLMLARLDAIPALSAHEYDLVNLTEIAADVVRRGQALAAQREMVLRAEGSTEPVLILGDAALIEQAVLALLDNAIKYNQPKGHVTIRASSEAARALLEVSDTGVGIANEHLSHVGERFYRVDKARSRKVGGTGLGLSIVANIARVHGGTLLVTSELRKGTI